MQDRAGVGGPNAVVAVKQQIQVAQNELNKLKEKISKYGNSDGEIPNFKPNSQKTKSFIKRLEYSGNIQFGNSNKFLPTSSDVAANLGYKLDDKKSFGVGVSYKLGLGRGWDNIKITSEGIGIRSYLDWKLKANFFLSGGYEQNYLTSFRRFFELQNKSAWQSSAILGLSKKIKLKAGKTTKIQLLYDFFSTKHNPTSQPIIFRTGISFK